MPTAATNRFHAVKSALETAGFKIELAEVQRVPKVTIPVSDEAVARSVMKLIESLEDNDDVQNVYANHEIDPALLAKVSN